VHSTYLHKPSYILVNRSHTYLLFVVIVYCLSLHKMSGVCLWQASQAWKEKHSYPVLNNVLETSDSETGLKTDKL